MRIKKTTSSFLFLFLLFLPLSVFGQGQRFSPAAASQHLYTQLSAFPQEKIHLHTDHSSYLPGEKIWFKAYLTDAQDLSLIPPSRYVYVELHSPDSLITRVKIMPQKSLHYGYLEIPLGLSTGDYTLCAYTKAMTNKEEACFFKKIIYIGSTAKQEKEEEQLIDYKVSVFPEGGYLLEGTLCRVAFKAVGEDGRGQDILYAELTDEEGVVCKKDIRSSHLGMGSFSFIPEKGKSYTLNCRNALDVWQQAKLPQARTDLATLVTYWRNDNKLAVRVMYASEWKASPLYLVIHGGGKPLHVEEWTSSTPYKLFAKEPLTEGILHLLLVNGEGNVLSERLVFCRKKEGKPQVSFLPGKENYMPREKVTASFSFKDKEGNPLKGHFSVAVTDDAGLKVDNSVSIQSSLLLTSELKGYIENPAYYFDNPSVNTDEALDHLLMTQGWRRYDIPEVLKGNISFPQIQPERTPSVSGKVTGLTSSKGLKGCQVSFISPKDTLYALLDVDDQGMFNYTGYEYADSLTFFLQAYSKRGGDRLRIKVDKDTFPEVKPLPERSLSQGGDATNDIPEEIRYRYDSQGVRIIELAEVTARVFVKKEKVLSHYTNSATSIIDREEIERFHQPNLKLILDYMPGKRGNSGTGSLNLDESNDRVFMLDGMEVDDLPLESITADMIEQIEFIPATIFGSKYPYGVTNIITRYKGVESEQFNVAIISPLGAQTPVEFYSPQYETDSQRRRPEQDYRNTVYWKPDLIAKEEGEATVTFYTSDAYQTTYSVVIEGITTEGELIRRVEKLKVGK